MDIPILLQKMEVIDLPHVTDLESRSYPHDEAASRQVLDYRINYASHLCYIAYHQEARKMVGYVVSTGASSDTKHMRAHHMRNHYQGDVLCIHSVVIDPDFQRRGYGTFMMKSYLNKIKDNTNMRRVLLLSKKNLVHFYENVGFKQVGVSSVSHGREKWIEMEMEIPYVT